MFDVVTLGETMVLLSNENGQMLRSPLLSKRIGGAESNVAIGLTRLGHKVAWVSKLGEDPFGDEILYHLRGEGINTEFVLRDPGNLTGLMIKDLKSFGDPSVYYYRKNSAASTMKWAELPLEPFKHTKIIHLTGITPAISHSCRSLVHQLVEFAKVENKKISFDPNLRLKLWSIEEARKTILELLPNVDYFFPGIEEAELLAGVEPGELSPKKLSEFFHGLGMGKVILKLGDRGCTIATPTSYEEVSGFRITPVDTVGAGDGFCAGFLSGLLDEIPLMDAARRANAVGAITGKGDYDQLPSKKELEYFMFNKSEVKR
ncbi:sugar kinase [Pseudalkalibacillus sp. A8]|uniref:sugar kinase n=1 Tax=Pseudalkalibacillus sp. A8 TaxID=3382641 RepID=UPI0038B4F8C3